MPVSSKNKKINLTKDRAQTEVAKEPIPSAVDSFYHVIKKFQFLDIFLLAHYQWFKFGICKLPFFNLSRYECKVKILNLKLHIPVQTKDVL